MTPMHLILLNLIFFFGSLPIAILVIWVQTEETSPRLGRLVKLIATILGAIYLIHIALGHPLSVTFTIGAAVCFYLGLNMLLAEAITHKLKFRKKNSDYRTE